jgi:hypothetical protein
MAVGGCPLEELAQQRPLCRRQLRTIIALRDCTFEVGGDESARHRMEKTPSAAYHAQTENLMRR